MSGVIDFFKEAQVMLTIIISASSAVAVIIKLYRYMTKKTREQKEALDKVIQLALAKIENATTLIMSQQELNDIQDRHIQASRIDRKTLHTKLNSIQLGVRSLLGSHVDDIAKKAISRGFIYHNELLTLTELFEMYEKNCGNGTRKVQYNKVLELPVRKLEEA